MNAGRAERNSALGIRDMALLHEEARMRNRYGAGRWMRLTLLVVLGVTGAGGGCAGPDGAATGPGGKPPPAPLKAKELREAINAAYAAFERKQYDEAMAGADRVLAGNPQSPGAAEAQYLRG